MSGQQLLTVILSLVSAAIGAYFGAYLKKKGENVALREEFAEVKRQLRETTLLSEQIRRSLTTELWLAQERWKLKKELYISMLYSTEAIIGGVKEVVDMLNDPRAVSEIENDPAALEQLDKRMQFIASELRKAKASAKLVSARASAIMDHLESGAAFAGVDTSDLGEALQSAVPILEQAYEDLVEAGRSDLVLEFAEHPAA